METTVLQVSDQPVQEPALNLSHGYVLAIVQSIVQKTKCTAESDLPCMEGKV